jgi:hypothetical protein
MQTNLTKKCSELYGNPFVSSIEPVCCHVMKQTLHKTISDALQVHFGHDDSGRWLHVSFIVEGAKNDVIARPDRLFETYMELSQDWYKDFDDLVVELANKYLLFMGKVIFDK